MWEISREKFLQAQRDRRLSDLTVRNQTQHLQWFCDWASAQGMWGTNAEDITTDDLEAYRLTLLERGLASSTANLYVRSVRTWLRKGVGVDRRIELLKEPKRLPRPMPESMVNHLVKRSNTRLRTLVLMGAYAGLRVHEMAMVTAECVDRENKQLRIIGKGNKERVVPLHRFLSVQLEIDPPQLLTIQGYPYTHGWLTKWFNAELKRHGCGDYTAHTLRHRFGTVIYQATQDIYVTAKLMGHDNINTTQVYADLGSDRKQEAIESI